MVGAEAYPSMRRCTVHYSSSLWVGRSPESVVLHVLFLSCLYWSVLHLVFRLRCLRCAAGDGKDVRWRKEERLRLLETGE